MFKKRDQELLAEAYNTIAMPAPGMGVGAKPVVLTMDLGAPNQPVASSYEHEDHYEEHDDSEIQMAAADLHKIAMYAPKLQEMVQSMPGLEGWVAAKITKAADYISSVYHWLEYEQDQDNDSDCGCNMYTDLGSEHSCEAAAHGCKCGGCPECV